MGRIAIRPYRSRYNIKWKAQKEDTDEQEDFDQYGE